MTLLMFTATTVRRRLLRGVISLDVDGAALLGAARVFAVRLRAVHGDVQADPAVAFAGDDIHELFENLDDGVADDEGVRGAADGGEQLLAEELTASFEVFP